LEQNKTIGSKTIGVLEIDTSALEKGVEKTWTEKNALSEGELKYALTAVDFGKEAKKGGAPSTGSNVIKKFNFTL